MYFYIDESGHTGGNLFDKDQPMFYYGVLSSPYDLDVHALDVFNKVRTKLGVEQVHAKELGKDQLEAIADDVLAMQTEFQLRFDICRVAKYDHVVISFFDQVFDSGMNDAVAWDCYNTPKKYALLFELAALFDEDLAKKAWAARISADDSASNTLVQGVCDELIKRVGKIKNPIPRKIISAALKWARSHTSKLSYNISSELDVKSIGPNVIGFQSALLGISTYLNATGSKATKILVDRQIEFNCEQKSTAEFYPKIKDIKIESAPSMPTMDLSGIPDIAIEFSTDAASVGLELVDIHLWSAKRVTEHRPIGAGLTALLEKTENRDGIHEVSLEALFNRWRPYFLARR